MYTAGGGSMDSKVEFLFLNEEDMIKAGVLDADRAVDTVGEVITLLSEGDYLMGGRAHNDHGVQLIFPEKSDIPNFPLADSADRRFMAMPAYLGGRFHMCGEKWYGSNGNNRSIGLPRSILMMMLNDVETGKPLAYMSGNLLSSMRTGAMPGLAAKLLARDDSKVLTLVGPGVICRSSLRAIMSQRFDIDTIKIKGSSPTSANAIKMKEYIEENYPQVKNIVLCRDMEEALKDADIITEAVSCKEGEWPEYKREWLKPGALVISTSTFNMEHKSIVDLKKVIDNYGMYENYAEEDNVGYDENGNRLHTGCMGEDFVYMVQDGLIERDSLTTFGEIIRGKKPGRESDDEIILVSIEGMPTEDVAWAYECYTYALVHDIGTKLKVWDRPYAF
ncbi:putative ornithine cyclodeaminase [Coprococcus eutactus ATCC 27759]|jgi:ornithine cyclodeaminase/alanine dehydrogenase-like protein (mu-crystallin family)|nr:putative ornithine cyclodeaminase [Coprococcus eutactus ATCC 27759]